MHHVSGVFDLDYKSKKKGKTVSTVYDMVSKQQLRLHEQADLEIRKYALSGTAVTVSCQRPGEKPNMVTIAWAGTVCSDPAMVSISIRPERHSYDIIKETGEFVINLTTKELTYATDYCGVKSEEM